MSRSGFSFRFLLTVCFLLSAFAVPSTTDAPTEAPSIAPSVLPTAKPTTLLPTEAPTAVPSVAPTLSPSLSPTTSAPSLSPTIMPTVMPTVIPTIMPTIIPTGSPTTTAPSAAPSVAPSNAPVAATTAPTVSMMPSTDPTVMPTVMPTTLKPTVSPSLVPSVAPSNAPTAGPTTVSPSTAPSVAPSDAPSTIAPSMSPSFTPSFSMAPSFSLEPTSLIPTYAPTQNPTQAPSLSKMPTQTPTVAPTVSVAPSQAPSAAPSTVPSAAPSVSMMPTVSPTLSPTLTPGTSEAPSTAPSCSPTVSPTTIAPSLSPTATPSLWPTVMPTVVPTQTPSVIPTESPSEVPTQSPSAFPTLSTGWLNQYGMIDNLTVIATGLKTGVCTVNYYYGVPSSSSIFICGDGYYAITYFPNSLNCTGESLYSEEDFEAYGPVSGFTTSGVTFVDINYFAMTCTTDIGIPAATGYVYATQLYYPETAVDCTGIDDANVYTVFIENDCLNTDVPLYNGTGLEVYQTSYFGQGSASDITLSFYLDYGCSNNLTFVDTNVVNECVVEHPDYSTMAIVSKEDLVRQTLSQHLQTRPSLSLIDAKVHAMHENFAKKAGKKSSKRQHHSNKKQDEHETESTRASSSNTYWTYYSTSYYSSSYYYDFFNHPQITVAYQWINIPVIPSAAPSLSPSAAPSTSIAPSTFAPTGYPTYSSGWLNQYGMDDDLVLVATGQQTGVCFPLYYYGYAYSSIKYNCGPNFYTVTYYDDLNCTDQIYYYEYPLESSYPLDGFSIGSITIEDVNTFVYTCTLDIGIPVYSGVTYATQLYYPETADGCPGVSEANVFSAIIEGECLNITVTYSNTTAMLEIEASLLIEGTAAEIDIIAYEDPTNCVGEAYFDDSSVVNECVYEHEYYYMSNTATRSKVSAVNKHISQHFQTKPTLNHLQPHAERIEFTQWKEKKIAALKESHQINKKDRADKKKKEVEEEESTYSYSSTSYYYYSFLDHPHITDTYQWVNMPVIASVSPTPAPTFSVGWLNQYVMIDNLTVLATGEMTGICTVAYDYDEPSYSVFYGCESGVVSVSYFYDLNCTDYATSYEYSIGSYDIDGFSTGNLEFVDANGYVETCTSTIGLPTHTDEIYATELYYAVNSCPGVDEATLYSSVIENDCLSINVSYYDPSNDDWGIEPASVSLSGTASMISMSIYDGYGCGGSTVGNNTYWVNECILEHDHNSSATSMVSNEEPSARNVISQHFQTRPTLSLREPKMQEHLEMFKSQVAMKKARSEERHVEQKRQKHIEAESDEEETNPGSTGFGSAASYNSSYYSSSYYYYYYSYYYYSFLDHPHVSAAKEWINYPAIPSSAPSPMPLTPSARPSPGPGQPTIAPTVAQIYQFTVTQGLNGISATTFNSNVNNSKAFIASAAASMPPLTSNDITINSVVDVSSGRRQLLRSRLLTSTGVNIGYTVKFNLASTGFANIDAAYASFSTNLNASVTSGAFNTLLNSYSTAYGATDMSGVTSSSVTISEPTLVVTDDDNSSNGDNNKSNLALALGLGLGLGGGLCCIGIILFVFFGMKGSEEEYEKPKRKKSRRGGDEEEGSAAKKERRNKKETDILMGESSGARPKDKVEMTDNPSRKMKKTKSSRAADTDEEDVKPSGRVSAGEKQSLNKSPRSKSTDKPEKFTYPTDRKETGEKSKTRPTKKDRSRTDNL